MEEFQENEWIDIPQGIEEKLNSRVTPSEVDKKNSESFSLSSALTPESIESKKEDNVKEKLSNSFFKAFKNSKLSMQGSTFARKTSSYDASNTKST